MKYSDFKNAILAHFNSLQDEGGEEFLELMVDTIDVFDTEGNKINTLFGWEYSLSRSRHWDKEQENHIMFDGFTDEHLTDLYDTLLDSEAEVEKIVMNVDGMNDLDEPIHKEIVVEF